MAVVTALFVIAACAASAGGSTAQRTAAHADCTWGASSITATYENGVAWTSRSRRRLAAPAVAKSVRCRSQALPRVDKAKDTHTYKTVNRLRQNLLLPCESLLHLRRDPPPRMQPKLLAVIGGLFVLAACAASAGPSRVLPSSGSANCSWGAISITASYVGDRVVESKRETSGCTSDP